MNPVHSFASNLLKKLRCVSKFLWLLHYFAFLIIFISLL
jgi:hypothetical protein